MIGEALERTLCYTLEVSMCGGLAGISAADLGQPGGPQLANEATYMDWGKQLVLSIGDFYLSEKERSISIAAGAGAAAAAGGGGKRGVGSGAGSGRDGSAGGGAAAGDAPTVGGVRFASTVEPPSGSGGVTGFGVSGGAGGGGSQRGGAAAASGGRSASSGAAADPAGPAGPSSPLSFGWKFPAKAASPGGAAGAGDRDGRAGRRASDDNDGSDDRPGSSGSDGSMVSDTEEDDERRRRGGGSGRPSAGGSGGSTGGNGSGRSGDRLAAAGGPSGPGRGGAAADDGASGSADGTGPRYMRPLKGKSDSFRQGAPEASSSKQWPSTAGAAPPAPLPPVQAITLQPRPSQLGPRDAARRTGATGNGNGAAQPGPLRAALSAGTLREGQENGGSSHPGDGPPHGDDQRRSGSGGGGRSNGNLRVLVPSDTGGGGGYGGAQHGGGSSQQQQQQPATPLAPPLPSPANSGNRSGIRSPNSGTASLPGGRRTGGQGQQSQGPRSSVDGPAVKIVTPTALRSGPLNGSLGRVTLTPLPQQTYDRYSGSGGGGGGGGGRETDDGDEQQRDREGSGGSAGGPPPQQPQPPMSPSSVIASAPGPVLPRARSRPAVKGVRRLASMPPMMGRAGSSGGQGGDAGGDGWDAGITRDAVVPPPVHPAESDLGSNAFILWGRMPTGTLGGGAGRLSATLPAQSGFGQFPPGQRKASGGGAAQGGALGQNSDPFWLVEEAARERSGFLPTQPVRSKTVANISPQSAAFAQLVGPPPVGHREQPTGGGGEIGKSVSAGAYYPE